jgi:hypothetical protein
MKPHKFFSMFILFSILCFLFTSCLTGIPKQALMLSPESLSDRQLQTRVFETDDELQLLTASAAVLQDTGFTIDESEVKCGVIIGSRQRDVTDTGEVMLSFFLSTLFVPPSYAKSQKVLATLVTNPLDNKRIAVRITFQHMVWNQKGELMKNERLNEPEIYQEFFSKLSKSLFLTAHEI